MADNVPITAGAGTAIAADDVSSVYYQRVKLDGGGDGASTPILAGGGVEASALRVTIANDSTGVVSVDDNGSTVSVDDGGSTLTVDGPLTDTQLRATAVPVSWTGYTVVITATITRDSDAAAYTPGDVISTDAGAVLTFTNCARANGGSGFIIDAVLIDSAVEATKLEAELYLFDTTIAAQADHAAFSISDAEAATFIGMIDFGGTPDVSALNGMYHQKNLNIGFVCGGSSRNLFGRLVARNAYDGINGEVFTIRLKILQD